MTSPAHLIAYITKALALEQECEISRDALSVLWKDGHYHRDELLMRIHRLAGLCDANVRVTPGLARATFVRRSGVSGKSEESGFVALAQQMPARITRGEE